MRKEPDFPTKYSRVSLYSYTLVSLYSYSLVSLYSHSLVSVYSHSLVSHLVDGDAHVTREARTRVHVAVVLGHEVDVVEDDALEPEAFQRLDERHVHQASFVERVIADLCAHKTADVKLFDKAACGKQYYNTTSRDLHYFVNIHVTFYNY